MNFILSEIAQLDIDDIYEFSIYEFGLDRTVRYLMEMEQTFNMIATQQYVGTNRAHIAKKLFAIPYEAHVIYYEIKSKNTVVILRIVHGSCDVPKAFY
jgi:toxin ParE1/3/4